MRRSWQGNWFSKHFKKWQHAQKLTAKLLFRPKCTRRLVSNSNWMAVRERESEGSEEQGGGEKDRVIHPLSYFLSMAIFSSRISCAASGPFSKLTVVLISLSALC